MQKNLMNHIDLDLTYLASHVLPKENEFVYVEEKALVRFQFLEIILRLANDQYLRRGICGTLGDAVELLF